MRKIMLMSGGGRSLVRTINNWQNAQTTLIHAGGSSTVTPFGVGLEAGTTAGITMLTVCASGTQPNLIRQPGYIWGAKVQIRQVGAGMTIKFKVFRLVGSDYVCQGESELFPITATGVMTCTFAAPIPCQVRDMVGVWLSGTTTVGNRAKVEYAQVANANIRYVVGDVVTQDTFATSIGSSTFLGVELMCHPPYLAVTGDSIPEGHHTVAPWHGFYHAAAFGLTGTITSEIDNQLRGLIGNGAVLQYQNHALGSQTFAWALSTGVVSAIATGAGRILIHCGANDVGAARTWAAVQSDLDAIKALTTTQTLLIDEILPGQNYTDGQAATVRLWNGYLATWCAANGAVLVRCHDEMGQIRAGTGQIDDLLTEYNYDGTHFTQAGVDRMARIWLGYLSTSPDPPAVVAGMAGMAMGVLGLTYAV